MSTTEVFSARHSWVIVLAIVLLASCATAVELDPTLAAANASVSRPAPTAAAPPSAPTPTQTAVPSPTSTPTPTATVEPAPTSVPSYELPNTLPASAAELTGHPDEASLLLQSAVRKTLDLPAISFEHTVDHSFVPDDQPGARNHEWSGSYDSRSDTGWASYKLTLSGELYTEGVALAEDIRLVDGVIWQLEDDRQQWRADNVAIAPEVAQNLTEFVDIRPILRELLPAIDRAEVDPPTFPLEFDWNRGLTFSVALRARDVWPLLRTAIDADRQELTITDATETQTVLLWISLNEDGYVTRVLGHSTGWLRDALDESPIGFRPDGLIFDLLLGGFTDRWPNGQCADALLNQAAQSGVLSCDLDGPPPSKDGPQITLGWNSDAPWLETEVAQQLIDELGYSFGGDEWSYGRVLYRKLATGELDLYLGGDFPDDGQYLNRTMADGTPIGQHVTVVSDSIARPNHVAGYLVTRSWVLENQIVTLDQINGDPALAALLDRDGDGLGEIFGCPTRYTCSEIIDSQIAFADWSHLEQISDLDEEESWDEFISLVRRGDPAVAYVTSMPFRTGDYVWVRDFSDAIPGEDTLWLSVEPSSVLDESNPLQLRRGEELSQRAQNPIRTMLGSDVCAQPATGCLLGWHAIDRTVVANSVWLEANPGIRVLIDSMEIPLTDVIAFESRLARRVNEDGTVTRRGTAPPVIRELATQWINNNRSVVDEWLDAARLADPTLPGQP